MICNRFKIVLFIILSIILSGCATVYRSPKLNEPKATIRGFHNRSGLFTWLEIKVESIDNQSPGLQVITTSPLNIYPGQHKITAIINFNQSAFSSGPYTSIIDVATEFKPFENYILKAKADGSLVSLWIENSKGQRVSAVTSAPYYKASTNTTIFIPIQR